MATSIAAVAAAQQILKEHWGTELIGPGPNRSQMRVDGRWGTYSQHAYSTAPAPVRQAVDEVFGLFGTTAKAAALDREMEKRVALPEAVSTTVQGQLKRYFDLGAIAALVRSALAELSAGPRLAALGVAPAEVERVLSVISGREIIDLEAAVTREGYYDAFSVNPTSTARGLFQFLRGTWNDMVARLSGRLTVPLRAVSAATSSVAEPGLPFDAVASAYVYAEYTTQNALALTRARLPVTAATLYTLHQQGTAGGIAVLKGKRDITNPEAQSRQSLAVIAAAKSQVNQT